MKTIFEKDKNLYSKPFFVDKIEFNKRITPLNLPNTTELEVMRHYKELSDRNFCIEKGFYPLGSCTMKYNPRINEFTARLDDFANLHPLQDDQDCQGALELMYDLEQSLKIITGMDAITLQPCAGAHGEFCAMNIVKKYFEKDKKRKKVIIPDNAHGTNPMSAKMNDFDCIEIKSDENGGVNFEELKKIINEKGEEIAAIMMTNPNTLGLFDENILKISELMHKNGSLLYYDGANLNAVMGHTNPRLMGFDIVHLNLHKTFSTPHGGGGPGAGPVGVIKELEKYLPIPRVEFNGQKYFRNYEKPYTIGKVSTFFGNFSVLVRAYTYILSMGKSLKNASSDAVLAANYIKEKLKKYFKLPYNRTCMHEFVLSGDFQKEKGVSTLMMAKRLMDSNCHPPTIYFPLIVHEAMMIEPCESETKEVLDNFINTMIEIAQEVENNPEKFNEYPTKTPILRADETLAARQLNTKYEFNNE